MKNIYQHMRSLRQTNHRVQSQTRLTESGFLSGAQSRLKTYGAVYEEVASTPSQQQLQVQCFSVNRINAAANVLRALHFKNNI